MSDSYGHPCNEVPYELPGSVGPQPMNNGNVDKDEVLPLFDSEGRQESIAQRLRKQLQAEALYLQLL